jgi:hypothetical protein
MLSILLYADDIVLVAESAQHLQCMLNCLFEWCMKWRLVVNEGKTKVMHIRPSRTPLTPCIFKFGNKVLDIVQSYKYLGIYVNEHVDYKYTATMLAAAGSRALGSLRNRIYNLKNILLGTYTQLFTSGVTPILDYCAGVWGFENFKCVDDVQLKAARYFLGVHKFCPLPAIEGDIGWVKSVTRRKLEVLKLYNKIVTLDDHRLPRRVLNHDISIMDSVRNWSSDLAGLLLTLNVNTDISSFELLDIDAVNLDLKLLQENNWNENRSQKIKLRNYNLFKTDMTAEPYALLSLPKRTRSLYAQFRTGILPLTVEVGRFHGLALEDRCCPLCEEIQLSYIEDEFHLLCICQSYNSPRLDLYAKITLSFPMFPNLDDFEKFLCLNSNFQIDTAKFISSAMQIRQSILYSV